MIWCGEMSNDKKFLFPYFFCSPFFFFFLNYFLQNYVKFNYANIACVQEVNCGRYHACYGVGRYYNVRII